MRARGLKVCVGSPGAENPWQPASRASPTLSVRSAPLMEDIPPQGHKMECYGVNIRLTGRLLPRGRCVAASRGRTTRPAPPSPAHLFQLSIPKLKFRMPIRATRSRVVTKLAGGKFLQKNVCVRDHIDGSIHPQSRTWGNRFWPTDLLRLASPAPLGGAVFVPAVCCPRYTIEQHRAGSGDREKVRPVPTHAPRGGATVARLSFNARK